MYPIVQHKKPIWAYVAALALLAMLVFVQSYYLTEKSHGLDLEQASHKQTR